MERVGALGTNERVGALSTNLMLSMARSSSMRSVRAHAYWNEFFSFSRNFTNSMN